MEAVLSNEEPGPEHPPGELVGTLRSLILPIGPRLAFPVTSLSAAWYRPLDLNAHVMWSVNGLKQEGHLAGILGDAGVSFLRGFVLKCFRRKQHAYHVCVQCGGELLFDLVPPANTDQTSGGKHGGGGVEEKSLLSKIEGRFTSSAGPSVDRHSVLPTHHRAKSTQLTSVSQPPKELSSHPSSGHKRTLSTMLRTPGVEIVIPTLPKLAAATAPNEGSESSMGRQVAFAEQEGKHEQDSDAENGFPAGGYKIVLGDADAEFPSQVHSANAQFPSKQLTPPVTHERFKSMVSMQLSEHEDLSQALSGPQEVLRGARLHDLFVHSALFLSEFTQIHLFRLSQRVAAVCRHRGFTTATPVQSTLPPSEQSTSSSPRTQQSSPSHGVLPTCAVTAADMVQWFVSRGLSYVGEPVWSAELCSYARSTGMIVDASQPASQLVDSLLQRKVRAWRGTRVWAAVLQKCQGASQTASLPSDGEDLSCCGCLVAMALAAVARDMHRHAIQRGERSLKVVLGACSRHAQAMDQRHHDTPTLSAYAGVAVMLWRDACPRCHDGSSADEEVAVDGIGDSPLPNSEPLRLLNRALRSPSLSFTGLSGADVEDLSDTEDSSGLGTPFQRSTTETNRLLLAKGASQPRDDEEAKLPLTPGTDQLGPPSWSPALANSPFTPTIQSRRFTADDCRLLSDHIFRRTQAPGSTEHRITDLNMDMLDILAEEPSRLSGGWDSGDERPVSPLSQLSTARAASPSVFDDPENSGVNEGELRARTVEFDPNIAWKRSKPLPPVPHAALEAAVPPSITLMANQYQSGLKGQKAGFANTQTLPITRASPEQKEPKDEDLPWNGEDSMSRLESARGDVALEGVPGFGRPHTRDLDSTPAPVDVRVCGYACVDDVENFRQRRLTENPQSALLARPTTAYGKHIIVTDHELDNPDRNESPPLVPPPKPTLLPAAADPYPVKSSRPRTQNIR